MKKRKFFRHIKPFDRAVSEPDKKAFHHKIEICNYSPQGYFYSEDWVNYIKHAQTYFRGIIKSVNPDEFNDDMLDADITANRHLMQSIANGQRVENMHLIWHNGRVMQCDLNRVTNQLQALEQDLIKINKKLNDLNGGN